MAEDSGAKQYGLRLTLGGASSEAHTVTGYTGWFWKDHLTPVGGPYGEVKLDKAKAADKDDGVPLKLEPMSKAEADKRRKEIEEWRGHVRRELRTHSPADAGEAERKADEQRAATPPKEG